MTTWFKAVTENVQTLTRPARRWTRTVGLAVLAVMLVVLIILGGILIYAAAQLPDAPLSPASAEPNAFDGRVLYALSDADMAATAYATGVLEQVAGLRDMLTLITPDDEGRPTVASELIVSNSVMSWPQIAAASPDGQTIYVVEARPEVADDIERIAPVQVNWPAGALLTRINLADGIDSAVTETFAVGVNPVHLALSPDGRHLAIGFRSVGDYVAEYQLAIIPTEQLSDPTAYATFVLQDAEGNIVTEVSSLSWHPSGNFLGMILDTDEIAFYRVTMADDQPVEVEPFGNRLTGHQELSVGRFSLNGQFYFASELRWDQSNPVAQVINPPGEMIAVRFDDAPSTDTPQHAEVSRVRVGLSPEGWTLHPSGEFLVTVDMNRTYLPDAAAFLPGARVNSLTLVRIEPTTGVLTVIDQYGFEGVLPEDAVFDTDGDALAVVVYEYREDAVHEVGGVEFWNFVGIESDTPRLERTNLRLDVMRGPHVLGVIP